MRLRSWTRFGLAAAAVTATAEEKPRTLHGIQEKLSQTLSLPRHHRSELEDIFTEGGHRRLDECGTSYTACLYNAGCLGCVTEISDATFDDDTLTDDVVDSWTCDQLLYFLQVPVLHRLTRKLNDLPDVSCRSAWSIRAMILTL